MNFNSRKSVSDDLKKYNPCAKDSSFIEVIEWSNGDGIDINIDDKHIELSFDELEAINYLSKVLQYENN